MSPRRERLTIRVDDAVDVTVVSANAATFIHSGQPYIRSPSGESVALTVVDVMVWLAMVSGSTIQEIYDNVTARWGSSLSEIDIFAEILSSLRRFYQSQLLTLHDIEGQFHVLAWHPDAINTCHLMLTHRCNLRCSHCYLSEYRSRGLPTSRLLALADELHALGCETITLSGGEASLRQDFPTIISKILKLGIEYGLNTNAMHLGERVIEALDSYRPSFIGVSIYGDTEDLHNFVTGNVSSYQATIDNIKLLRSHNLPVTIKCMIMEHNAERIENITKLAESLECDIVFDAHIFPKRGDNKQWVPNSARIEQLETFYSSKHSTVMVRKHRAPMLPDSYICSAGQDRCAVDVKGEVFPCAIFPLSMGNINEMPLKSILVQWRQHIDVHIPKVEDINKCARCKYQTICSPCPGANLIEEGSQWHPSRRICLEACLRGRQGESTEP